ncbi:TMV resistance protein N isoform X2 [Cajanus cajan]|uniref:TMV resistance protein N isoform X2 n=1 Tax=Cajanus cajan TaxID=3821 RepID=UPI00098D818F|nr:TMV resistance protein N isoform X2 [Cajanus cajan]
MSSVSFSYGWNYDVFLSFRGSDTRHGFTGHLYKALCDRGIHTFIDDEELQRGEEITPSLLKAIQESRIAIPVFSKNYASSTFCLDELVSILACFKEKGRLVLPVFYDVDPSHVRHQIGNYEEALNSHKERFNDQEKLQKWKIALRQVADLSGYHFKHGGENEYEFIGKIVIEVSQKINRTLLHVADYPVGLESPLLQVNSLLNIESGGVHVVGIYGIGGVGKTTIARAIYNLIADQFEGLCFLDNVRETSIKHGLVHLQEAILSKSIGEDGIKLGSVNEGIPIIKHRLHLKKVLLVLDDVDKLDQLQATVGGTDWFGSGSRIIITTRDRHLLKSHGVEKTYEVDMLNKKDAFKLLSWSAFKTDKVDSCYQNILNRVVTFTSGLPLALEVIGSNLFGKRIEEWESALDRYERIPNKKIQDILRVSFDSLEEDEQDIFLDIACCFKGYALTYVKEILSNHHGFRPEYGIGVLIDKSLVKIDACGCVTLHDLIEDMGKEIVRKESPEEPGKRSRLWCPEDIVEVLEENKGTKRIQIINLDYLKYEVEWNGMGFKEMTNLKTLIIRDAIFTNGPKHLPNSLRVLEWWRYPSSSLPFEFHPKKLVILRLPYSCFCSRSLDLFMSKKMFVNTRVLNFNGCHYITEIPDVCGVPNLQELSFRYCENLIKIHESVGFLDKLKTLDADGCSKLRSFPPIKLTSLQELCLTCCPSLESFPKILGKMDSLTYLCIRGTPIKELPVSIQNLTQLGFLELMSCGIVQLPSSIFAMQELRYLTVSKCEGLLLPKEDEGEAQMSSTVIENIIDLKECCFLTNIQLLGCGNIQEIRGVPPNIETFYVKDCSSLKDLDLTLLPKWTQEFHCLRKLHLYGCNNLQNIKGIPANIEVLMELHEAGGCKEFCLPGTRIPEWFEHCTNGSSISFWFRNKFPAISVCAVIKPREYMDIWPVFTFNGKKQLSGEVFYLNHVADHLVIFDQKQKSFDMRGILWENEWHHVECTIDPPKILVEKIGIHVFKQGSNMEDIEFTNPQLLIEEDFSNLFTYLGF